MSLYFSDYEKGKTRIESYYGAKREIADLWTNIFNFGFKNKRERQKDLPFKNFEILGFEFSDVLKTHQKKWWMYQARPQGLSEEFCSTCHNDKKVFDAKWVSTVSKRRLL